MPSTALNTILHPLIDSVSQWKHNASPLKSRRRSSPPSPPSPPSPSSPPTLSKTTTQADKPKSGDEKAQLRRAQVRRAQIQHRQRKAHYIAQLELDIMQLREMVAAEEAQAAHIQKSNDATRRALASVAQTTSTTTREPEQLGQQLELLDMSLDHDQQPPSSHVQIARDDVTVSFGMNYALGTPCLSISDQLRLSPPNNTLKTTVGAGPGMTMTMTPHQETRAINFILALEHGCWVHFFLGDFPHRHDVEANPEGCHGHHLTASAYLMASAPESIYSSRAALEESITSSPPPQHQQHQQYQKPQALFQWSSASGISLERLHGLATSLNQDEAELTPVQAWFDLMGRYGLDEIFRDGVLEALERELSPLVRCLRFGAVIARENFEGVVGRTLPRVQGG